MWLPPPPPMLLLLLVMVLVLLLLLPVSLLLPWLAPALLSSFGPGPERGKMCESSTTGDESSMQYKL